MRERVVGLFEVAEVAQVRPTVVRRLEAAGLVRPEVVGETLRYGPRDVELLERTGRLMRELGVNMAGVEVVLHLLERVEALQRQLERQGEVRLRCTLVEELPEEPGEFPEV